LLSKEDLAKMLNGCEYGEEVDRETERLAEDSGLVIVFGASDDLCELRGAICDECGAPGFVPVMKGGVVENECDSDYCPYFEERVDGASKIEAKWYDGHDNDEPAWSFETKIPYSMFNVFYRGELWCVGIVFSIEDLE